MPQSLLNQIGNVEAPDSSVFALIGGLLAMAWFILVARRLFQLGRGVSQAKANLIGGASQ